MLESLKLFIKSIPQVFQDFDLLDGVTVTLIFALGFFIFNLLSKNNASKISVIFFIYVLVISFIAIVSDISRTEYVILIIAFVVCIILLFATEIKRSVWNVKLTSRQHKDVSSIVKSSAKTVTFCINEIIKAVQTMAKNDTGAIIVLSNSKIPDNIVNSGVRLEANISSAVIESVFFPKNPLHDGAMIIQNDKILAAGCFLPLSQETDLPKELGTRHRAGIGITEMINVTAIIVSEETGIISIAQGGKITRYADSEMLRQKLKEFYWQDLIGNK